MRQFLAQTAPAGGITIRWSELVEAALFSVLGVILFVVLFWIVDKMTPYDLKKELLEKNNTALAVVVGACAVAIGLIVSASVRG